MHPKIVPSFWSDADFEAFEGAELAEIRLTFLWAVTSPGTDMLGIFTLARRRFALETGLDPKALERAMQALPKGFVQDPASGKVLLRNYIRYQYGCGLALAKNNMAKPLKRAVSLAPEALAAEILRLYPELNPLPSPPEALGKPFPPQSNQGPARFQPPTGPAGTGGENGSPCQGDAKGQHSTAQRKHSTAQQGGAGGTDVTPPTVEECIAAGAPVGLSEEECRAFHAHYEGLGWHYGTTPMRKPLSWLGKWKKNGEQRRHLDRPGRTRSARLDGDAEMLRARLQIEKNPAKREEIERQIKQMENRAL